MLLTTPSHLVDWTLVLTDSKQFDYITVKGLIVEKYAYFPEGAGSL